MIRTLLLSGLLLASFTTNADTINWSGFYAGVNVGVANSNNKTNYAYSVAPASGNNFNGTFGPTGPLNVTGLDAIQSAISEGIIPANLGSGSSSGFIGGGQIGYNWQQDAIVYGVEADLNYLDVKKSYSTTGLVGVVPNYGFTNTSKSSSSINWLSTIRGRAGYAVNKALFYVTGGLAFGDTKSSSSSIGTDNNTDFDVFSGSKSSVRFGGVIGAGAEYALNDNLSARVEAEYFNLGTSKYGVDAQPGLALTEGITTSASHKFDGETLRFGINYKF